jgi:glycogen(starch) synthase
VAQWLLGHRSASDFVTRSRVAIVTTYYRPVLGGAEVAAERLARFLDRRGHRVIVLTKRIARDQPARELLDGVDVERLGRAAERSGRGKWAVLPAMFQALIRHRADVDAVCCIDYRGVGLAALAARVFTRVPVIFQAQTEGVISAARVREWLNHAGAARDGMLARLMTWPARALYGRADAIACISRGIERETLDAGVPRSRVHYLPNPVDTSIFSQVDSDARRVIRERLGLPADAVIAVFVGRLSREKGALELIRAWAQARPHGLLVLVGPAMTDHPWDVSADARRCVEREGLSESVRFAGAQPPDAIASWLQAADFAVQPSHFEAMGLAAAEAMAAGLPVIATATGGYRDFVRHEENGLLVPPQDVSALATAIARLTTDAPLRTALGSRARSTAGQFDEAVVLERFAHVIEALARHD